jgi:hypothetical protein
MTRMRRGAKVLLLAVLAVLLLGGGWLAGRLGMGSTIDAASLPEVERRFVERMQNVKLVGSFTVDGREPRPSRSDGYEIESVEKVGTDSWRFNAKFGRFNTTIPIVVPLRFVGDTPVIMMTDTALPGIGTFTVRLFFYGDRYSGTWQHGEVGGQMSGRIEPAGPK